MFKKVRRLAENAYVKATIIIISGQTLLIAPAYAGSSSSMPWDTPMQSILSDFTGTVAKIIGAIIIGTFGFGFAASESGGTIRKALGIIFGITIAFGAVQWGLPFFGYSGGAAL